MSTVEEYHKSARDCLRWAAKARTEEQRKQFLSLAHDWGETIVEQLAGIDDCELAMAAYQFAVERWPKTTITLVDEGGTERASRCRPYGSCPRVTPSFTELARGSQSRLERSYGV